MREGWEYCELEKHIKLIDYRGRTPIKTDSGIKLITAKNVKLGYLQDSPEEFIAEDNYEEWMRRGIPEYGDVIFTTEAPLANVAQLLTYEKVAFAQRTIVMQPKPEFLDKTFLKYLLLSPETRSDIFSKGTGATVTGIKSSLLKKIIIPIPPLQEQQQIVAIVDKAFEAIDQAKANIEKNIANAKELFQSKLNAIFSQKGNGWKEKSLEDLGTLTSSKRIYKKEYVTNGIPFYRSKEIKELAHDKEITIELFIKEERYEEIKSQFGIPQEGDILLTAVGTIGEMHVVRKNEPAFYFKDGNIMWLKNFSTLNTYYLKYALLCYVEQLKAMSQGSAYSALTIEKLKKYSISVPSISEQEKIVKQLDEIVKYRRQVTKTYKEKIKSLEDLKKSILQKAFAGELTNKEVEV